MKETAIFIIIWMFFIFFSLIFLSKRIALLSIVPIFCAVIAYFSHNTKILAEIFLILFLIYLFSSKIILKGEKS
ncbi:MAG: hypothetical protein ABIM36_00935 [candidate division WOR-3 bacterium]